MYGKNFEHIQSGMQLGFCLKGMGETAVADWGGGGVSKVSTEPPFGLRLALRSTDDRLDQEYISSKSVQLA